VLLSKRESLLDQYPNVRQIVLPARKGWWARLLAQLVVPIAALVTRADLVHFAKSQASWVVGVRTVVTLFDLTTLHQPQWHGHFAVWYWRHIQPLMVRQADAIVTLSKHVAQDIVETYHIGTNQLFVVPCAPQPVKLDHVPDLPKLPARFVLFVGMIARKKNLGTLIRAIALLGQHGSQAPSLVLAGPRYELSDDGGVLELIRELNLEGRVHYLGAVSIHVLDQLYRQATLFAMPSVHEGFGIPCLEAMQRGTPVIAAHASALPEVVGDAGLLVEDYLSPQAWAQAISTLWNEPLLRNVLIARGYQRVQCFNWEKSAQMLAHVYAGLLRVAMPA
jgi:glycosyltransferase involved in cell wall biosynthesis